MPIKLVRRPKTPNWVMRGTIRGIEIEETTGTTNKKAAEAIRIEREREILEESVYGKKITITFIDAALDYIEHGRAEKRFLKPLVDYFGSILIRKIDQHTIDVAAKKLLPKASAATRNRQIYTPMSAILYHAARKGWCTPPNLQRPRQPPGKVRWITLEEAERLFHNCAAHLRPLVVFLIYTGARIGEALWLDWNNINLDIKQVTFPKTKNGEARSVPLHPRVIQELLKLDHRKGSVFRTHLGQPYCRPNASQDNDTSAGTRIRSAFQSACGRAGIADFTPHSCRHTWATWHYQKNLDLIALQKLGGWKTLSMVMRYTHTNVSEHATSIDKLPWGKSGEELKNVEENKTCSIA